MVAQQCQGCEKPATSFQCPLCQAENKTDMGFFCSQECFATNWLNHRNTFHKSGVVKEKRLVKESTTDEAKTKDKKKKRSRKDAALEENEVGAEGDEEDEGETGGEAPRPLMHFPPWCPLPSAEDCRKHKWATVTPTLPLDCPRAVVETVDGDEWDALWPAAVAAAEYITATLAKEPKSKVLVVAGSPATVHAFAWAARCAGLGDRLRLAVACGDVALETPSQCFTGQRPVVVATEEVICEAGGAEAGDSGEASLWLPEAGGLLITLPDVEQAGDIQGVQTRGLFFVSKNKTEGLSAWSEEESKTHQLSLLPPEALYGEDNEVYYNNDVLSSAGATVLRYCPVGNLPAAPRLDNELCTSIANGDDATYVKHVERLYSHYPGQTEEILRYSLTYSWGAMSVCHLHHRLAKIVRLLVDGSAQFSAGKGSSLADIAVRTLAYVVRQSPPLTMESSPVSSPTTASPTKKKKLEEKKEGKDSKKEKEEEQISFNEAEKYFNYYNKSPNLQLQATLCYLFDHAAPNIIDTLGLAWGIHRVLPGKRTFHRLNGRRSEMVARIKSRYSTKINTAYSDYLVILAHMLYDAVAIYSLSVEELEQRLCWSVTVGVEVGDLRSFLYNCFLISGNNSRKERKEKKLAGKEIKAAEMAKQKKKSGKDDEDGEDDDGVAETKEEEPIKALSSRITPESSKKFVPRAVELYEKYEVKAPAPVTFYPLNWKVLPLTEQKEKHTQKMRAIAVNEILMALPPKQKPMYIGSVGNLIGKWSAFNARFDGCLGISLAQFLSENPDDFQVVGTLVTRKKAGKTEQVRMRFDQEHDDDLDSEDDEGRKTRDRRALTGQRDGSSGKKELPRRAQKKNAVKEFNRSRFNRNHKQSDPSARVPGYIKHGPRRIKGRGTKVNKRNFKRSA